MNIMSSLLQFLGMLAIAGAVVFHGIPDFHRHLKVQAEMARIKAQVVASQQAADARWEARYPNWTFTN